MRLLKSNGRYIRRLAQSQKTRAAIQRHKLVIGVDSRLILNIVMSRKIMIVVDM